MNRPPEKRARDALVLALGWTAAVALLLFWSSGFAGGIEPLFDGNPIAWVLAISPIVPIVRWLYIRTC